MGWVNVVTYIIMGITLNVSVKKKLTSAYFKSSGQFNVCVCVFTDSIYMYILTCSCFPSCQFCFLYSQFAFPLLQFFYAIASTKSSNIIVLCLAEIMVSECSVS